MGWKEGSAEKIMLHGLIGGIMADINGGKFGEGLTVGAINEILIGQLSKLTKKDEKGKDVPLLSSEQMRWISAIVGGVVSEATGGNAGQGGSIADSATANNFYAHMLFKNELNDEIKEVVKDEALAEKIISEIDAYLYGWDEENPTAAREQDAEKIIKEILNNNGIYGEQAEQIGNYYKNKSDKILNDNKIFKLDSIDDKLLVGASVVAVVGTGYVLYRLSNGVLVQAPALTAGGSISTQTAINFANQATKKPNAKEVVLGKYNSANTALSYQSIATQRGATYFQIDSTKWNELSKTIGENGVWEINKQFLSAQVQQGKTFIFTSNPNTATGYFAREVEFLRRTHKFVEYGNYWKTVPK